MHAETLARRALDLADESAAKLERWLDLFEEELQSAEQNRSPGALREFVAFTAALERLLKIARLAEALQPEETDAQSAPLDPEALRKLLSEED